MAPPVKSKKRSGDKMEGPNHSNSKRAPSKHVSSTSSTPTNAETSPPSVTHHSNRSKAPINANSEPNSAQRSLRLPPRSIRPNVSQNSSRSEQSNGQHQLAIPVGQCPQHLLRQPSPPNDYHNEEEVEDEESSDEDGAEEADEGVGPNPPNHPQPHNHMAAHMSLEALLNMPGRDALPRLSQDEAEGIWFDRNEGLVTKVGKILQDNFDGPYYSWNKLPTEVRDLWFSLLAYEFNWDPVITPQVREEFDEIIKRRLKGMISYRRVNRRRPCWITKTIWEEMEAEWRTEDAQRRSKNASDNRNSNREGLGVYKHAGGPKSTARIKRDMEKAEGREVSVGEVFIKAHTGKDGQIVDGKAKKVVEAYKQSMEATLSELSVDPSFASDGASQTAQLTLEQQNALFYKSSVVNDRGEPFGLGSLAKRQSKRLKTFVPSTSPKMLALEQELKETKAQMAAQKQAMDAQKQASKNQTDLLIKYLKTKDPELPAWLLQEEAEHEEEMRVDENQLNTTVATPSSSPNTATV